MLYLRMVYAVNWYNVAAVFAPIAKDLHLDIAGLGLATAVFIGSVGIFQLPGGLMSAKIGTKRTVIAGMLISSVANLFVSAAGDIYTIVLLRLVVGLGMALVFAPGAIIMVKLFGKRSEALGMGLYNSTFNLGGFAGIIGSVVASQELGWRPTIAIGALLGLSSVALCVLTLPGDSATSGFKITMADVRKVLLDKPLLLLSITALGLQLAWNTTGNLMVFYLEAIGIQPTTAGVVGSTALLVALVASPVIGRVHDAVRRPRRLLISAGLVAAVGAAFTAMGTLASAFLGSILIGAASGGGLTVAFVVARELNRARPEYDALSVGLINGVSNFASLTAPAIFSIVASRVSYQLAWAVLSVYVLVIFLPIAVRNFIPDGPAARPVGAPS